MRYSKWAENDTYGGVIEAVATDQVDFGLGFFILILERSKYYSIISQFTEFR